MRGWTGLAAPLTVLPVLLLGVLVTDRHDVTTAVRFDALVVAPATLAAAAMLYAAWRITPSREDGWITAAMTMLAIECVMLFGLQIAAPRQVADRPFWMLTADLACLFAVLCVARLAGRSELTIDPGWAGCLIGSGLGIGRILAVKDFPQIVAAPYTEVFVAVLNGAILLATVLAIMRIEEVELATRVRLSIGTVALSLAHLAWYLTGSSIIGARSTMWLDIVGAAVLLSAALHVLRRSVLDERAEAQELSHRLQEVEADIRDRRARMHEINSTLAGIASATQVISNNRRTTAERCRQLEGMVQAELARLERLLSDPASETRDPAAPAAEPAPAVEAVAGAAGEASSDASSAACADGDEPPVVDLDETISTLALSQAVRGNRVAWLPSGERVSGDPDAVAEVINILLDNAAKHGGTPAEVDVRRLDDRVEIAVSDSGPGIAPEIRQQLFQWGARGPDSHGQGIGLNIAASLIERQGGYLRLRDTLRQGTTFVVGLQAARDRDGAAAQPA
jgi:signal transduction histidine kinase